MFEGPETLALEVEGHLLELSRREVVAERYLDHQTESGPGEGAGRGVWLEEIALEAKAREASLRAALGGSGFVLFLPSRAPDAWGSHESSSPSAPAPGGPFPLWDPEPDLPIQCVPHLLSLGEPGGSSEFLAELGPLDAVYLESAAAPLALARFLGGLRWAYCRGRQLGLRFYDPRVLRDLWSHLDPSSLGLLFGGAWTRDPRGAEDLLCPLCDASLPALSSRCSGCGVAFLGEDEAPTLIGAYAVVEEQALIRARPCTPIASRRALARSPQRGRKALQLPAQVVSALGAAYQARVRPLS